MTKYKIYNPVKGKKVFVVSCSNFSKIIKYSLTKEYNQLLNEEYMKYQIIKKNNMSHKYCLEDFNQIITLDNHDTLLPTFNLDILHNNEVFSVTINTSILQFTDDDKYYYTKSNKSDCDSDENNYENDNNKNIKTKEETSIIKKIKFIVCDYDNKKMTFDTYIYKNKDLLGDQLQIINSILKSLDTVYEEQHFIHGDFKLDNILLKVCQNENNNESYIPYLFDLEFSLLLKKNIIKIESEVVPRLNLYLLLKPGFIITKEFLHMFDYYLFTLTVYCYHKEFNKATAFMKLIKNNNNLFSYIYERIYKTFNKSKEISLETMLNYCNYDVIKKIIKPRTSFIDVLCNSFEYQMYKMYGLINDLN